MSHSLSPLRAFAVCTIAAAACSADVNNPPPVDMVPGTTGAPPGVTDDTGQSDTSATSGADTTAGSDGTGSSSTGDPALNCGDITCTGHGSCRMGDAGAYCACDEGYVLAEAGDTCVVDETCVKVRFLEDHCRQLIDGPPAVSLFFALDFCSGTAVTADKVAELGLDFVVNENGIDITNNVESDSTIVPISVESYVTLVVDVSDSVTLNRDLPGNLPALVSALRGFVDALEPEAGEPDVYVSVYVFGRFVQEYVPFTRDYAAVDTALAQIETDPESVVSLVNGGGTALYNAVETGILRTQRIRDLRDAVSWGGVLSTGTVVVVTDGQDSSNAMLDQALIDDTVNQVISIGISKNVNDRDLEAIGRDGSFLAPTSADWEASFAEVAQRVDEYPDRAYLLAYCSSTTEGNPEVEVTLSAKTKLTVKQSAVCQFDADVFSSSASATCTQDLFVAECAQPGGQECGGLTACGACADDECCDGWFCVSPTSADGENVSCGSFDELCSPTEQICVGNACVAPDDVGGDCDPGCNPSVSWCDDEQEPAVCVAALALGEECEAAVQCQSLNCQQTNPENPFEERTCQPPALVYDRCEGGAFVRCEEGSFCQGSACVPKQLDATTCSSAQVCRSGLCEPAVQQNVCTGSGSCFWPWNEKVPV